MILKDYIISHSAGNMFWKDTEGRYLGCNYAFAKIAKVSSPEAIIGKTDRDLFLASLGEDGIQALTDIDQEVMKTDCERILEEAGVDIKGNKSYYLTKKMPLKNDAGKIIGIMGTSIDITKQKTAEAKLARASKEKTEFIATLNNTLRSQISTISMMADMLRQSGLTDEQERYLDLLIEANDSMPDDLTYAGDYAKLDSGDIPLHWESLRLLYSIDVLQDRYYQRARQRGISFLINYRHLSDLWVQSAVVQLKEVLHTLLDNIMQYIEQGAIEISFSRDQQNHEAIIRIQDTSPGFESAYLNSMFSDEGLAADKEVDYPMMSMRFAFCRKMVESLKGRVWGESEPGQGATFYLALPLAQPNLKERLPDQEDVEKINCHRFIVVGEADAMTASLLSFFADDAVVRVDPAQAGEQVQQHVDKAADVDMVLLDQSVAEQHPDQVIALLAALDSRFSLCVVLCDRRPSYALAQLLDDHTHIMTLAKPLKWMRFYRELLNLYAAFHHQSPAVLVVEDNPVAQLALSMVLENLGCEVTATGSGEEALRILTPDENADTIQGFDAVFLDIGLPGKDGLAVAKIIHEKFTHARPPLIAFTGLTRKVDLDLLYESGYFKAVLEKPASAKVIEDTLAYIFKAEGDEF